MPDFHIEIQRGTQPIEFDLRAAQSGDKQEQKVRIGGKDYILIAQGTEDLNTIQEILQIARDQRITSPKDLSRIQQTPKGIDGIKCKQIRTLMGTLHDASAKVRRSTAKTAQRAIGGKGQDAEATTTVPEKPRQLSLPLDDVITVLRSTPGIPSEALPREVIEKIYTADAERDSPIGEEFQTLLADLDLDVTAIPQQERKAVIACLLLARNEENAGLRRMGKNAIHQLLYPRLEAQLKSEPSYEADRTAYCAELCRTFGMDSPPAPELQDRIYIRSRMAKPDSIIAQTLTNELAKPLMNELQTRINELRQPDHLDESVVEAKALAAMAVLNFLSEGVPVDDDHEMEWAQLDSMFTQVMVLKATSDQRTVQEKLGLAFERYETFVEDGMFAYRMRKRGESAEDTTRFMYGMSVEQMESQKSANRAKVSDKLTTYVQQIQSGQSITIQMISDLHATNNKRIVPRHLSELRKGEVFFGKRVGVMPQHVQAEFQLVLDKANHLIQHPPRGPLKQLRLSVQVAKLHNQMLDIHPFADRNGSTSLLFCELLMATLGGYSPPRTRVRNYNRNLSNILGNSTAVALVSYEHYKIAHRFGHYKSKTAASDEATVAYYEKLLAEVKASEGTESVRDALKKIRKNIKHIRIDARKPIADR